MRFCSGYFLYFWAYAGPGGGPLNPDMDAQQHPSRTILLLETNIDASPWGGSLWYGSVHGKGTATKAGAVNGNGIMMTCVSAFADLHVETWTYDRAIAGGTGGTDYDLWGAPGYHPNVK